MNSDTSRPRLLKKLDCPCDSRFVACYVEATFRRDLSFSLGYQRHRIG